MAFTFGPGGPVNAILATQSIYQILINALIFEKRLSPAQSVGVGIGLLATLAITLGDTILQNAFPEWYKSTQQVEEQLRSYRSMQKDNDSDAEENQKLLGDDDKSGRRSFLLDSEKQ